MDYYTLLDLAADLGYRLAMNGAETYRIEESVNLLLRSYGIESETFAIPNCLIVSMETTEGESLTRMRRIGYHGNDLDSVERYSNLSRRICAEHPDPATACQWLQQTDASRVKYRFPAYMAGCFLGPFGFSFIFGATLLDAVCAGFCGFLGGIIIKIMDALHANQFFRIIIASFSMELLALGFTFCGIADNADAVSIGALMLLVPGLLFTNAMRDIIYGDTNSGINRIVQVVLIAAAMALGNAAAWIIFEDLWGAPAAINALDHGFWIQEFGAFVGCVGFAIVFNVHGFGSILCSLGGVLAWATYLIVLSASGSDLMAFFLAAIVSSGYSEIMARVRKCPAIAYLVVSIFPLIPGASVYYVMTYAVSGDMDSFASIGTHTIAIAGVIAAGILMVSSSVRMWSIWKQHRKKNQLHAA